MTRLTSCGADWSSFWHTSTNFRDGGFEFRLGALAMNTVCMGIRYPVVQERRETNRPSISLKTVCISSCEPSRILVPTSTCIPTYRVRVNYCERAPRLCQKDAIPGFAPEHLRSFRGKSLCSSLLPPRQRISLVGRTLCQSKSATLNARRVTRNEMLLAQGL